MSPGRRHLLVLVLLPVFLSACAAAGKSTMEMAPPIAYTPKNEVVINRPFDEVWDRLVSQLSKSFYVINNIDKASRIINVSFTSDTPETYVDCGHAHRTFTSGGNTEEFDYDVASSSSFKVASKGDMGNAVTSYIDRKTSLEGRINVYVAPEGAETRVAVNARYILTMESSGSYKAHALLGPVTNTGEISSASASLTFNTDQPVTKNLGTAEEPMNITCRSKGKLEADILDFAR